MKKHIQLYINLMRTNKPVGIWLLLLPCWIGLLLFSPIIPLEQMLLFAVGAVAMRSAGCIVNDIADRHIDAQVERTKMRPIACGAISVAEALVALTLLLMVALFVALMIGWGVVALGACWLPLVAVYPFMKRITWWPQAFLGITFGAGGLFACVAMTGSITTAAMVFYLSCIFWVIGYDTIYACQDMADDAKIGVKSTALLFAGKIKRNISICYAIAQILMLASFILADVGMVGICCLCTASSVLIWQIMRLDSGNYAPIFKSNVWFGVIICAGLLLEKTA